MFVGFVAVHLHFPIVQVCKGDGNDIADDVHDDARDNGGAENDDNTGVITMTMVMKMLMVVVFFLTLHLHFPIVQVCKGDGGDIADDVHDDAHDYNRDDAHDYNRAENDDNAGVITMVMKMLVMFGCCVLLNVALALSHCPCLRFYFPYNQVNCSYLHHFVDQIKTPLQK